MSYASDNDGSAFITKAEFDSLKNTFQSQLNEYNTGLDTKIDAAISQYLAGVKTHKEYKSSFLCKDVGSEIWMMEDNNKLNYKYNQTKADMYLTARRGMAELQTPGTSNARGFVNNWKDRRRSGEATQAFHIPATNDGHRTIIKTKKVDNTDTTGEWYGYTETAQDTLWFVSNRADSAWGIGDRTKASSGSIYLARYQAKMNCWLWTGYVANPHEFTTGMYAQFNAEYSTEWRANNNSALTDGGAYASWKSDYGTIMYPELCVWSPTLAGDFTVYDNYRWQRTANKKWPDGSFYYGTTQDWITLAVANYYDESKVFNVWLDFGNKRWHNYLMRVWDGVTAPAAFPDGLDQWTLDDPGNKPPSGRTTDAWVPALGFHSRILDWGHVYHNKIKNVNLLQSDGTYRVKSELYLTEGLPLFEVDKNSKEYNFYLEFDTPGIRCYFTFDPTKYADVNATTNEPNVANLVPVYVDDAKTSTTIPVTTNTVTKFTIKPENVKQGTLFVKWTKGTPVSGKYNGGGTLKLDTHNTVIEVVEH